MARRLQLHNLLKQITANVYFQPPTTMAYPCIRYEIDNARSDHADNIPYRYLQRYKVTIIDRDPDSTIPDKVKDLPTCIFNRFFVADNLNHFVFTLYF
jgi:hypothetical protein